MTSPPTCLYRDPITQKVCGVEVKMPSMFADSTFGPYLCSEHVQRVNDDRDTLRAAAPSGWDVTDEPGGPALIFRRSDRGGVDVVWDPLAGVAVDAFLQGLP